MIGGNKGIGRALLVISVAFAMVAPAALSIAAGGPADYEYYVVTFKELPSDGYRMTMSDVSEASFLEYRQNNAYLVGMPVDRMAQMASNPLVSDIRPYISADKVSREVLDSKGVIDLRVNLHQGADVQSIAKYLNGMGARVTKTCNVLVNYIECTADASWIEDIAGVQDVYSIQLNGEKQTFMNFITANAYTGVDAAQVGGFRGSGMLAQVQDNGCDADIIEGAGNGHQDLDGIIYTDGSPVADDHGTCTSGIVFGNGAGDINAQGIAYQAVGSFADWGTGRTISVQNLWNGNFQQGSAGMNGVMQSNSWSQGTLDGTYTTYSNEDDQAAYTYQKVLTLWAAGNSNSGTGVGLITQDSANKNGMCIGAIFHQNTANMADDDYHDAGAGMTPSRGPAADGRMKPDMIAAFDWIYTVDMVGASGYVAGDYYDDFGGTSGATPTVAGCSLLAYEMYQENYFDNNPTNAIPYSATIKALMIADAYQYPLGTNAITRNVQGWGAPDMENMYNRGATYHVIEEHPQALAAGDTWSRTVYSDGSMPLKISVAWTDPAAPATTGSGVALINNLDLRVVSPGGTVYWGNNGLWTSLYSASGTGVNTWSTSSSYRDDKNNVENVFIQTPAAGLWTVEVSGRTGGVPSGPQHFSMVASGAQGISSIGTIALDQAKYRVEDTAQVTVQDLDLNINPLTVQTVNVNVASTSEPAGETVVLTETGVDTSTFEGTITLSGTNGAGILLVANGNTVTATYNDADAGGGGPAVVTDTATIDGSPPAQPTGLTVTWDGLTVNTLVTQDFSGAYPPAGWSEDDASGNWNQAASASAGGTSPEARFNYVSQTSIWRLKCGPINTAGLTSVNLRWNNYYDDYAAGVTVRVQTATSTTGPWTNSAWSIVSGTGSVGPGIQTTTLTNNVGSGTFYFAFVVDGNAYQLDYWYIDNVLLSYSQPNTNDNRLDWTLSNDDGAGANDVAKYIVYRSNLQTGPWDGAHEIVELPKGTSTYTDIGRGETDGTNWWYVVRAEDTVGNRETNTYAVPEIPSGNQAPTAPNTPTPSNAATGVVLNPTLSVRVNDPNGDTMTVRFYNAAGPTLIGTNTNVPSGTFTNMAWPGRAELTSYSWYATADDGEFVVQSATWSFTTMDTSPPGPATGLTVQWTGTSSATLIDQDFSSVTFPPTGWTQNGPTNQWTRQATANAGGTSPEARFGWVSNTNIWHLYAGPIDTTGMSDLELEWNNFFDDFGAGVTVSVQTSTDATTWHDTGWSIVSGGGNVGPALEGFTVSTADVGSSTFYLSFTTNGNAYQLDYWYIDNVLLTYTGGSTTDDNQLDWGLSSDDGAGANDVDHYNIYRALASSGPWDAGALLDTVPAGTAQYIDPGAGEIDGITWWYVVRAEDVWGNEEMNVNSVPEPGAVLVPYSINLGGKAANSWVFVSFPHEVSGSIQTLLNDGTSGDSGTTWTIAKWYNPQTPADPWKTYRVGGTANDMPTMTNQMGVWLWITANAGDQQITLATAGAYPASSVAVSLYAGWNLVGYPTATSRLASATLPAQVDRVSVWQAASPYIADYLNLALVTMSHGNAYWVHSTSATTWTVNP